MGEKSVIEWTATFNPDGTVTPGSTWNPVTGCSHVSPGCENCYAEKLSLRRGWSAKPWTAFNAAANVVLHPERLAQPLHWKKPRRIFVNSMSDLFHERIPDEFIAKVWAVMALCPQHTFQVLTKRPERMQQLVRNTLNEGGYVNPHCITSTTYYIDPTLAASSMPRDVATGMIPWPLPNVWLGVSVEDQRRADERIPLLLATPAAVRFLSCEPLLGAVDLANYLPPLLTDSLEWSAEVYRTLPWPLLDGVDWVITGGESGGPDHRQLVERVGWQTGPGHYAPTDEGLAWVRAIRDQCVKADVAFFHKQWGGPTPKSGGRLLDGRTWDQFPTPGPDGRGALGREAVARSSEEV